MDIEAAQYYVVKHVSDATTVKIIEHNNYYTVIVSLIDQKPEQKVLINTVVLIYSLLLFMTDKKVNIDWFYLSFANLKQTNLYLMAFNGKNIKAYVNKEITDQQLINDIECYTVVNGEETNE